MRQKSINIFYFFWSEFWPLVPSIGRGSSRSAGWTDFQLRKPSWSRVTALAGEITEGPLRKGHYGRAIPKGQFRAELGP